MLAYWELFKWLRSLGTSYDAFHVHGLLTPLGSLAGRLFIRQGLPLIIRPFGTLSRYTFSYRRTAMKRAYLSAIDRPNLVRAGAIHFTTAEERDEARWHGIDLDGRSFVVPPPFLSSTSDHQRRRWQASAPVVLFMSRLHPKKGLENLLRAWPSVLARRVDAKLLIAGDGEPNYVRSLKDLASRTGVAESISFEGFVTGQQKLDLLTSADVFVLPSFQENFGVAVMEAIAAGLPVVIGAHVQLASFVLRRDLGVVSEPNPALLADAIIRVLNDEVFKDNCRTRGPSAVQEEFSLQVVGEKLLEMYRTAIATRTGAPSLADKHTHATT